MVGIETRRSEGEGRRDVPAMDGACGGFACDEKRVEVQAGNRPLGPFGVLQPSPINMSTDSELVIGCICTDRRSQLDEKPSHERTRVFRGEFVDRVHIPSVFQLFSSLPWPSCEPVRLDFHLYARTKNAILSLRPRT